MGSKTSSGARIGMDFLRWVWISDSMLAQEFDFMQITEFGLCGGVVGERSDLEMLRKVVLPPLMKLEIALAIGDLDEVFLLLMILGGRNL